MDRHAASVSTRSPTSAALRADFLDRPMTTGRERRRQLRQDYTRRQRQAQAALVPIAEADVAELCVVLDDAISTVGCDHTTRHAERWATDHGVDWPSLAAGMAALGGHCDCEIAANCHPDNW